ncbi:hypothetical protein [Streptomyces sp. 8L]|uniref:hypothetical protein n=1 Tax=Streptomyces sp. 8L TaxID=2877242 RepID=UPI001CD6615C|nr:hypothetical protein [Streptomyces sp. 8L]MCA1218683.1 hypothetical protein [Streptomyces sp. 8L]
MATPDRVSEALTRKLSGPQSEGGSLSLEVLEVGVKSTTPELILKVLLRAPAQVWEVTLDYEGYEASLVSGDLEEESLDYLCFLIRTHLFEWWHTKGTEKISARMGKRVT